MACATVVQPHNSDVSLSVPRYTEHRIRCPLVKIRDKNHPRQDYKITNRDHTPAAGDEATNCRYIPLVTPLSRCTDENSENDEMEWIVREVSPCAVGKSPNYA